MGFLDSIKNLFLGKKSEDGGEEVTTSETTQEEDLANESEPEIDNENEVE